MILHGIEYQRPTSLNMRILADHVTYSFLAFMKSIFHFCLGCYCGGYSQNGRSNLSSLYLVTGKWLIGLRIHLLPLLKILCGWIFYNDLHNIKNYAHRQRFVVFCYCLIHIYLSISFRGEPRVPLLWRHNGLDGVSNHQPHHCLLIPLHPAGADNTTKRQSRPHILWDKLYLKQ